MRLSFVVPAYNEEAYLPACLESILAQIDQDPTAAAAPDRDHRRQQRQHRPHPRSRPQLPRRHRRRRAAQGPHLRPPGRLRRQHRRPHRQRRLRLPPHPRLGRQGPRHLRRERARKRSLAASPARSSTTTSRPPAPPRPRLLPHRLDHLRHQPLHPARRLHGAGRQLRHQPHGARSHRRLQHSPSPSTAKTPTSPAASTTSAKSASPSTSRCSPPPAASRTKACSPWPAATPSTTLDHLLQAPLLPHPHRHPRTTRRLTKPGACSPQISGCRRS